MIVDRLAQQQRERLVREALVANDRLVASLAEWVGRDRSGYDWQCGMPWRIESQIALMLQEINHRLEKCNESNA